MANITVSTDSNYSDIGHNDDDQITITNGAILTINTNTNRIEDLICTTLGTFLIQNTSNTTPIFINIGDDANSSIRIEKGGVLETQGAWITLGSSNGAPSQTFTLPTNSLGERYRKLGGLEVVSPSGEILLYHRVDSLVNQRNNEVYGLMFTHDEANGVITFGDGNNGFIPPNSYSIRVPNIQIFDSSSSNYYVDFDLSIGGTLKTSVTSFSDGFDFDLRNASTVELRHTSITNPYKNIHFISTSNIVIHDVVLETAYRMAVYSLSCNNMDVDNFNIYMSGSDRDHGLDLRSLNNSTIKNLTMHRPFGTYGHFRASLTINGNGNLFEDVYATSAINTFENNGSNNTYRRCFPNNAGSPTANNGVYFGFYLQAGANLLFEDCGSYPLNYADGGVPPRNSFYQCGANCKDITITGGSIYAGNDSELGRLSKIAVVQCPNVRINNIDLYGDYRNGLVDVQYNGINCEASNLRSHGGSQSNEQFDWASGMKANLVTMPQSFYHNTVSTDPDDVGADCASFLSYNDDDLTTGVLTRVMSDDVSIGLYEEITKTGVISFDNSSYLYIHNSNDVVTLETHVHHGIVSFTSSSQLPGSSTSNYSIEVALRNPEGSYSNFMAYNFTNMNTLLNSLAGYDPSVGLQIKYKVAKTTNDVSKPLEKIYSEVTIDSSVRAPFEITPTYLTIKNLTSGDSVYVEGANNTQKYFNVSDGSDVSIQLPNDNAGEIWKYVVKRAGFSHQSASFEVEIGDDVDVIINLVEKSQAIGGAMYTHSDVSSVDIEFDLNLPQMSIDISQANTSPQNVFDKTERALVTNDGMKWLAQQETDTAYQNLGGAGAFLFHQNNIRVRRDTLTDTNAEIQAFVFSTDGIAVDETNGPVSLFSGTLVKDVWEGIIDDYDDVTGSFGQAIADLLVAAISHSADHDIINEGVQKASILVPHNTDLT